MSEEKYEHRYAIKYSYEFETREEGYLKEEAGDDGLCDALLFFSILRPADGSLSGSFITMDGQNSRKPISDSDIHFVMIALAHQLVESEKIHNILKNPIKKMLKETTQYFRSRHTCDNDCSHYDENQK